MDRELLLEIGCEELPAELAARPDEADRRGRRRAAARAPAAAGGAGRDLQHAAAPDRPHRRGCPSGRPISRSSSTGRRCRRRSSRTARRRRPPPGSREAGRRGRRARARRRRRRASTSRSASGSAARRRSTCCPTCCGGTLRGLTFPKAMHWDAMLEDGRGELLFGRPIRWMLFLYGGRVVPFTIARTAGGADRAGAGRRRPAPSPTAIGS